MLNVPFRSITGCQSAATAGICPTQGRMQSPGGPRAHGSVTLRARVVSAALLACTLVSSLLSVGCAQPLFVSSTKPQSAGPDVAMSSAAPARIPTPRTAEAGQYRIGPEDVLDVSVLGEEDLAGRLVVGPDGWITFPMAGQLLAAGKTVGDLQNEIAARLSGQIRDPVVNVSIAEPAGYQLYVVGKVSKPGQFVVARQVDVLQALAMAGGVTPFANQKGIKVLRQSGSAGEQVFPFDYASILRGQNLQQNIALESGDVVMVP